MAVERCEMQVYRGGSREAKLSVSVDTDSSDELLDQLHTWLGTKGWKRSTWADFSADFYTRHGRKTVQADP